MGHPNKRIRTETNKSHKTKENVYKKSEKNEFFSFPCPQRYYGFSFIM
jgi:hypothetical protein